MQDALKRLKTAVACSEPSNDGKEEAQPGPGLLPRSSNLGDEFGDWRGDEDIADFEQR